MERLNRRLSVRLSEEEHQKIKENADKLNMSISDYVIHCCIGDKSDKQEFIKKILKATGEYKSNGKKDKDDS